MCRSTSKRLSWACTQFVRKSWIPRTVHFALSPTLHFKNFFSLHSHCTKFSNYTLRTLNSRFCDPPDPAGPMNRVKIFQGQPPSFVLSELVQANTSTNYFGQRKSTTHQCWAIKLVPHNLVRRIRCWSVKSLDQQFKYVYWTISKILLWNTHTSTARSFEHDRSRMEKSHSGRPRTERFLLFSIAR